MLREIQREKVKNILVVRQHNQIGDLIVSLPLYAALKKNFPEAKITLAASKTNYPIPYLDINPFIDRVITLEKKNIKNLYIFLNKLWKIKYQIGIVPSTIKISRTSHIINFISGAKIRIGVNSVDSFRNPFANLLTIKSDFFWNSNKVHQSERNLDIVKQIGCNLSKEEMVNSGFLYSADDKNFSSSFIEKNFPEKNRIIVAVHPGAGKEKNVWNYANFLSLILKIDDQFKPYLVITTGATDKIITGNLDNELKRNGIKSIILDNLPAKKLALILARINLYITNDTGTMHIAGETNVNQISLFGATKFFEWAPRGKNKFHIQSATENINDITVDEVYKLAFLILSKNKSEIYPLTGT